LPDAYYEAAMYAVQPEVDDGDDDGEDADIRKQFGVVQEQAQKEIDYDESRYGQPIPVPGDVAPADYEIPVTDNPQHDSQNPEHYNALPEPRHSSPGEPYYATAVIKYVRHICGFEYV